MQRVFVFPIRCLILNQKGLVMSDISGLTAIKIPICIGENPM